jgi:hypothetical protein
MHLIQPAGFSCETPVPFVPHGQDVGGTGGRLRSEQSTAYAKHGRRRGVPGATGWDFCLPQMGYPGPLVAGSNVGSRGCVRQSGDDTAHSAKRCRCPRVPDRRPYRHLASPCPLASPLMRFCGLGLSGPARLSARTYGLLRRYIVVDTARIPLYILRYNAMLCNANNGEVMRGKNADLYPC